MLIKEFDRQVEILLQKGYPAAADLPEEAFLTSIIPLKGKIADLVLPEIDMEKGTLPFVIVVNSNLVAAEKAMALVSREGKQGITKMYPREPNQFKLIEGVTLPHSPAYLLLDIDRGQETLNIIPGEALLLLTNKQRSPLTIEEGIALVTHFPDFLMKNNCFSLLASRYPGDKRVPAIWLNKDKHPNLGWCWNGNPHTWLGSASGGGRLGY